MLNFGRWFQGLMSFASTSNHTTVREGIVTKRGDIAVSYTIRMEIEIDSSKPEDIAAVCEELAGSLGDLIERHETDVVGWSFDAATDNLRDMVADAEEVSV